MKCRLVALCCLTLIATSCAKQENKKTDSVNAKVAQRSKRSIGWFEWWSGKEVMLTQKVLSEEIKKASSEGVIAWATWLRDNATKAETGYKMPRKISKDTMHELTTGQAGVRYNGPTTVQKVFEQYPILSALCFVMSIAVLHTLVLHTLYHVYGLSAF